MEGAAKLGAHMMGSSAMGNMMSRPVASGVIATTGYLAGRGLLRGFFGNPWVLLATGVAAGYFLHKYEKEIVLAVTKATGAGKDFVLHQKENLEDMLEQAKETEEQQARPE
jgi:hypothetical protein